MTGFVLRLVMAAVASGAIVGFGDALVAAAGARGLDASAALRMSLSLAALTLGPAALFGLLQAVLFWGLAGGRLAAGWRSLREDPARDRRVAAWLLAGTLAAGALTLLLAWLSPRLFRLPSDVPAREGALQLRGLVLAGAAFVALTVLALVAATLARVLQRALGWYPERWRARVTATSLALYGCALLGVAVALALALPRLDLLRSLDGALALAAVAFVALEAGILRLWQPRPMPGLRRAALAAGLVAVLGAGSVAAVATFDDPILLSATYQRTAVGKQVVSAWRRLLDFDGDGYAALLGGGDCDDRDSSVHPGARDIPGNGRDEDCSGTDARPAAVAAAAPSPRRQRTGANVLLLTIDTLRADHLGAYGYSRPTSPNLDAFARAAVVFERAYAASNHTPRSIPALLTGRYASRIRWKRVSNYPPLADGVGTVAADLRAAGYRTAGIFPHWYFQRARNLHQGFDVWDLSAAVPDDDGSEVTAPAVTQRAKVEIRRLASGPSPFFLWVHYYEPHHEYVRHAGLPSFGGKMMDAYDGEIRYVDGHAGELLRALEAAGAAAHTAVIVTSDHGEAFGEHQRYWHGHALYDEQVRVPLLVRAPGIAAARVRTPVSAVDVAPTILEIAGLPEPPGRSGRSLVPLARGLAETPHPVFVELLPYPNFPRAMRAVVLGDLKLIHDVAENRFELYDLAADPGEEVDLLGERPAEVERLKAILDQFGDGALATLY